jgi:hypothetical protein
MYVTLYLKCGRTTSDHEYWKNKDPVFPEDALIWFTDGSRADSGTGAGIYGKDQREALVSLWANMPRYSKPKNMPFYSVHMKI